MIRWLSAALIDWAIIVVAMTAAALHPNVLVIAVAIIVVGNRQHALGVLGHDGAHGLVARWGWLNDLLTVALISGPMGIPLRAYREFHLQHHRLLGTKDDPELWHKSGFPWMRSVMFAPVVGFRRKATLFILDLLGVTAAPEVAVLYVMIWTYGRARDAAWLACFVVPAVALGWYFGVPLLCVVIWYAATYSSFWAFGRLRIWREHIGTDGTLNPAVPWWGFLIHTPHGVGYHLEHHRNMRLAFHQLKSGVVTA